MMTEATISSSLLAVGSARLEAVTPSPPAELAGLEVARCEVIVRMVSGQGCWYRVDGSRWFVEGVDRPSRGGRVG